MKKEYKELTEKEKINLKNLFNIMDWTVLDEI
jgi:hypothetical protein